MTNETRKTPDALVWVVAAAFVAVLIALTQPSEAAEGIAGILVIYAGGSSLWTIGRWLWDSAQERRGPHRG